MYFAYDTPDEDHPRVCGEKCPSALLCDIMYGSPPRVRGKGRRARRAAELAGITPACAGKRIQPKSGEFCNGDHPRVCGEKKRRRSTYICKAGSPPRVRGKARQRQGLVRGLGITPACAGKRCHVRLSCSASKDHPRVCGEKDHRARARTTRIGSPPRVRGKDRGRFSPLHGDGITPACAGKSRSRSWTRCARRDHPRACGEKCIYRQYITACSGSPPPVRGKDTQQTNASSSYGITPACAGKSRSNERIWGIAVDHPRVCGEKVQSFYTGRLSAGSPPRVRGKGFWGARGFVSQGITPACAGKRVPQIVMGIVNADHPRVCGEKLPRPSWPRMRPGSPPRVRGKELDLGHIKSSSGITPACAGKRGNARWNCAAGEDHPRVCGEKRIRPTEI